MVLRRGRFIFGVLMLLMTAATIGGAGEYAFALRRWWEEDRPFLVLQWEMERGDDEAWSHAVQRLQTGQLSDRQAAYLRSACDSAIASPRGAKQTALAARTLFTLWHAGIVTDEEVRAGALSWLGHSMVPTFVPPRAARVTPCQARIRVDFRYPFSGNFAAGVQMQRSVILQRVERVDQDGSRMPARIYVRAEAEPMELPIDISDIREGGEAEIEPVGEPGQQVFELTLTERIILVTTDEHGVGPSARSRAGGAATPIVFEIPHTVTCVTQVLAPGETIAEFDDDPLSRVALEEFLASSRMKVTRDASAGTQVMFVAGNVRRLSQTVHGVVQIGVNGSWVTVASIDIPQMGPLGVSDSSYSGELPESTAILTRLLCDPGDAMAHGALEGRWFAGEIGPRLIALDRAR